MAPWRTAAGVSELAQLVLLGVAVDEVWFHGLYL
jgi:hypothetical protein